MREMPDVFLRHVVEEYGGDELGEPVEERFVFQSFLLAQAGATADGWHDEGAYSRLETRSRI